MTPQTALENCKGLYARIGGSEWHDLDHQVAKSVLTSWYYNVAALGFENLVRALEEGKIVTSPLTPGFEYRARSAAKQDTSTVSRDTTTEGDVNGRY